MADARPDAFAPDLHTTDKDLSFQGALARLAQQAIHYGYTPNEISEVLRLEAERLYASAKSDGP